jgi:hypothetical protein
MEIISYDHQPIRHEALAVVATGRKGEYRRIGFAEIHDRSFFVGTPEVEVELELV